MNELKNVTVKKAANIYYDGKVTSRTLNFEDGTTKSLGIMLPGEYTFNTNDREVMEMLSGTLEIRLPGETVFKILQTPTSFEVPANSAFDLKIKTVTDYCCSYFKD